MKALIAALLLVSPLTQAATPWEKLTAKTFAEGSAAETTVGILKNIKRSTGNQTVYFTVKMASADKPPVYTAVIENLIPTTEGKFVIEQNLFWFAPTGELVVSAAFRIKLRADKSFESREELAWGSVPSAAEAALWNEILAAWDKEL